LQKKVYEKTVGEDKMVFVEGGNNPKSVTLLLRASSKRYLDEFHRNALNAFYVLRNFIENPYIVYGAGSVEGIIAQKIRKRAVTVEGKAQIAVERFADAVEEIPMTLAHNIGMNVLDTLTQFRAKFAKSNGKMNWYGINSNNRKISDMSSSEIIETVVVKQQVFKTAVEATNMILNIDDVFMKNFAAMIRTKGEPGTGNVAEAVTHIKKVNDELRAIKSIYDSGDEQDLVKMAREFHVSYDLVKETAKLGRLPVVNFAAGGVATPADAAYLMSLGCDGIFVGSGIFKADDAKERARAIVLATTFWEDPDKVKEAQKMIDERQSILGLDVDKLELRMQERGSTV